MKNVAVEGTGQLFGFKLPDTIYSFFFCIGLRGQIESTKVIDSCRVRYEPHIQRIKV
jgi:hypothetical protein